MSDFYDGFADENTAKAYLNEEKDRLNVAPFAGEEYGDLKRLFDYTKFHVGLYSGIVTAVMAYIKYKRGVIGIEGVFLWIGVLCVLVAGLAGGVILGNLPHFRSYEAFKNSNLKWLIPSKMKYDDWAWIEHRAFWVGLFFIVITFFCGTWGRLEIAD